MTPQDMAALHAAAFPDHRHWSSAEFTDMLAHPGTWATGDARAFVLTRQIADEAEILTVATDPRYRRQGLAKAALKSAEHEAQARGVIRIILEVAANNDAALSLYKTLGYLQIGRRRNYYMLKDQAAMDAVIMEKTL